VEMRATATLTTPGQSFAATSMSVVVPGGCQWCQRSRVCGAREVIQLPAAARQLTGFDLRG